MRPYCEVPRYCDTPYAQLCTGCRLEAAWANLSVGLALAGLAAVAVKVARQRDPWRGLRNEEAERARLSLLLGIPLAAGGR